MGTKRNKQCLKMMVALIIFFVLHQGWTCAAAGEKDNDLSKKVDQQVFNMACPIIKGITLNDVDRIIQEFRQSKIYIWVKEKYSGIDQKIDEYKKGIIELKAKCEQKTGSEKNTNSR